MITYGGAVVYVDVDGYGAKLDATIPFDEMLQKLDQWGQIPFVVDRQQYADVNCDGKQECILWLKQTGEDSARCDLCVLNLQDGKMYAYIINYVDDCEFRSDGSFCASQEYSMPFRLAFDHDEAMRYYVSK